LNDLTCSKWVPLMSISSILWRFFVHFRYFVFCSCIFNPTSADISFSCWKVSTRECVVLVTIRMSSAYAEHCFMRVDMFPFRYSCFRTLSITILNKVADKGSPCLSLETVLNSSVSWLPIVTFAVQLVKVNQLILLFFRHFIFG
jgi:hypothetical protein